MLCINTHGIRYEEACADIDPPLWTVLSNIDKKPQSEFSATSNVKVHVTCDVISADFLSGSHVECL